MLSWVVVVQEIMAAPILLSVPSQHTAPRVPVEGEERVDSPAGCSGQARKWLSQLWGPCLTAGRPCAEERGSGLVCIKQILEALASPLLGLGLPLLGLCTCSLLCAVCLSKSLVWSAVVASAFHCGRVIP